MGSGKTQAAMAFMNAHPRQKFIYISPYKTDGPNVAAACPSLHFALPANIPAYSFSKTEHCRKLLERGKNIACTHELFKRYNRDVLDIIREQGYTLIIDEEVSVLEECDLHPDDLELLKAGGYVTDAPGGCIQPTERRYYGNAFKELFRVMESRSLNRCGEDSEEKYFYWQLPPDLLLAFEDVYILTFMFYCQDIRYMLDIGGITYQHIYIRRTGGGRYAFSDAPSYLPPYVAHLSEMIDIYEGENLNAVGRPQFPRECPLSMNWFSSKSDRADELRKNLINYFAHYTDGADSSRKMWGTYTDGPRNLLSRKGYAGGFVTFNMRGSNEYRNRDWLAYCVNIYMSPRIVTYYSRFGIEPNGDARALSTMIQWIWRSAIRDGQKIHIYIPSERMRGLLKAWIAEMESMARSGSWCKTEALENIAS